MLGQNHFAEPNWHVLNFLHPILICRVTYWAQVEFLLALNSILQHNFSSRASSFLRNSYSSKGKDTQRLNGSLTGRSMYCWIYSPHLIGFTYCIIEFNRWWWWAWQQFVDDVVLFGRQKLCQEKTRQRRRAYSDGSYLLTWLLVAVYGHGVFPGVRNNGHG